MRRGVCSAGGRVLQSFGSRKGNQGQVGIDLSVRQKHKPRLYPVRTNGVIKSKEHCRYVGVGWGQEMLVNGAGAGSWDWQLLTSQGKCGKDGHRIQDGD